MTEQNGSQSRRISQTGTRVGDIMFTRLIRALLPREEPFIAHFSAHARCMVSGARALTAMMNASESDRDARFQDVCRIESEADAITRETLLGLHRAFLTPFDRSSIYSLITAQDDVLDMIEDVAQRAIMYGVQDYCPIMLGFAQQIEDGAILLSEIIPLLSDISRNADEITSVCEKVSRIESEADRALRAALSDLFKNQRDPIVLIARKEIYELLETVTDRMDDVGDLIEGIVLDHV